MKLELVTAKGESKSARQPPPSASLAVKAQPEMLLGRPVADAICAQKAKRGRATQRSHQCTAKRERKRERARERSLGLNH